MNGVKFDGCSTNIIMITHCVPIPDCSNDIQGTLSGDVHRILPTGIKVIINDAGLCNSLLVFIGQDHVRVTSTIHIASLQIFGLHNFDSKDVGGGLANLFELWRSILCNDIRTSVDVDFTFKSVKLRQCILDVVQFDQGLSFVSGISRDRR